MKRYQIAGANAIKRTLNRIKGKENYAIPDMRDGNKRKSVKGEGGSQFRLALDKARNEQEIERILCYKIGI